MGIAKTKRDLIDILLGVPKDFYEKGPRPPLHHPDVIKAQKEKEEWLRSKHDAKSSEPKSF